MSQGELNLVGRSFIEEHKMMLRWMRGLRVTGASDFRNTSDGATISIARNSSSSSTASNKSVTVKISSAISGQTGRYNAKMFKPPINTAATGNLAEANLGTLPASDDCVVWNEGWIGGGGSSLATGTIVEGRIAGTTTDGKRIVLVSGGGGAAPSTLPVPTAQYQCLCCTSYTDSTNYTLAFDWVRGHP